MTEQDLEGYEVVDDFADDLRELALDAWNVNEEMLVTAESVTDLPVVAAVEGPQGARRMFVPAVDPYRLATERETPLRYAVAARTGIDLVRFAAMTPHGEIEVIDAASFTTFSSDAGVSIAGKILNLNRALEYDTPEPSGWTSTAPDLWVQDMQDWHERIDMREVGGKRIHLLFKTFPSSQIFMPSAEWF